MSDDIATEPWLARQAEMEDWYRRFLGADASSAEAALLFEYAPYAEDLAAFTGRVLDVGGGAGLSCQPSRARSGRAAARSRLPFRLASHAPVN